MKSKKEKEKKKPMSSYECILIVVAIVFLFMVVAIIVGLVLGYKGRNISTDIFGLLPAILSIMVILVVPKHLVQSECKLYFENKEYKDFFREEFASKDEVDRVDAHLSRMIGVYLHEKYPIWAVGWAFRSLKRYVRLPESNKIYNDFLRSMNEIITVCEEKIIGGIYNLNKTDITEAVNNMINNSTPISGDKIRVVERAVKDIIDYIVYGRINPQKNIKEEGYQKILLLLTFILKECEGNRMADYKNFDELTENICGISDYTQEEKDKGFFHNEIKKFFHRFNEEVEKDKNGFYHRILKKDTSQEYSAGDPLFNPQINEKIRKQYKYVKLM